MSGPRFRFLFILSAVMAFLAAAPAARAATDWLVVTGAGGEAEFSERFSRWGERLRGALMNQCGVPEERIVWLSEKGTETGARPAALESIEAAIRASAARLGPEDQFAIVLIGHGAHIRGSAMFNIPGPDLTAAKLGEWLAGIKAGRTLVLNAASAGAPFINALGAPGRIVVSATKSASEVNAPRFMEFFIQGLEEASADEDRDGRITAAEAASFAARLTAGSYANEKLLATEHALLDGDGDGLGARLPFPGPPDPAAEPSPDAPGGSAAPPKDAGPASEFVIKDYGFPPEAPAEAVRRYLAGLDAVRELVRRKKEFDEAGYYERLEALLVEMAEANETIRGAGR